MFVKYFTKDYISRRIGYFVLNLKTTYFYAFESEQRLESIKLKAVLYLHSSVPNDLETDSNDRSR